MQRDRILITGPGGRVGKLLCPLLRQNFALRLFDLQPFPCEGDDEFIQGDIRNTSELKKCCEGVTAMIHLAAVSDEADFLSKLMPMNIEGVYSAFEAARQAGVPKVVFTSTAQTVLTYGKETWVTPDMPVRPWTIYGCTKVFGEALARYYVDHHGMAIICLRLAWFQDYNPESFRAHPELWHDWCSPRDFAQLVTKALLTKEKFGIFFGISKNQNRHWDLSNGEKLLGYKPEDDSAEFAARHNLVKST